jgi:glycine/D-amino acid oxidase-like deaminating enzyme
MSDTPARASAVIIGAGIVGNSLVHHLARLGWRDLVLVDKGPMPNPGGSTGHASNFIFPIEYSKMMMELTRDSTEQYQALGVFTQSGGIEVARTEARMHELRRRCTAAKAWGIPAQLLSPGEVRKLVPYLDESVILGGASFPTVGVVDSLRAGTLMREQAEQSGALHVLAGAEVLGIDTAPGGPVPRVRAVRTSQGDIETPVCVICCGVWSPRIARMAGARIPLTPIVHQMISVGPVPLFADTSGEIAYPIVRDVDTNMYERQHGGDMEVGSYAHRPIIVRPDDIPSIEESPRSPTELPFTRDDFDPQLAEALELMPELLGDERVGIRYEINGLISMTPDGHPVLGETPEVAGLWSVAASWIKEGPGIGRAVAEWMSGQEPEIDIQEADIARFYPCQRTVAHVQARAREGFNKMYGIVHPAEQWESGRPVRVSPVYGRERELGAVFFETAGWERPHWYASNEVPARALRGPADAPGGRVGGAVVVAGHQRRAPGHARRVRPGRPVGVRGLRHHRAGRAGDGAVARGRAAGRGARAGRLHLAAGRAGRVQGRPDHHAARRRPLPGGDRRRHRHGREEMVHRPSARRRDGRPGRPDLGLDHAGAVGPASPGCDAGGQRGRLQPPRIPVRHLP